MTLLTVDNKDQCEEFIGTTSVETEDEETHIMPKSSRAKKKADCFTSDFGM